MRYSFFASPLPSFRPIHLLFMPTEQDLLHYCLQHTTPPSALLQRLERETHLRTLQPQMLSGPFQGRLLQFISQMIRPRRILEIGTFTGYASICLAQGLPEDGLLHTIEVNDELQPIVTAYLEEAGLRSKIILHLGDATTLLPQFQDSFDLVFLDAGKLDYGLHYELVLPKIRPGGFLIADNVLWSGKVLRPEKDSTAQALNTFNAMVQADQRVENLILPLRDGLMLVRKR